MIKVCNLHKSFGELKVLRGIDIHIKQGEIVVVLGPSGSGKSTFLRCRNCMEDPNEGNIYFHGVDLADMKVTLTCYDLSGKNLSSKVVKDVDVPANSRKDLFKAELDGLKGNYMVRLVLSDRKGKVITINDYMMRGEGTEDFTAFNSLGKAQLKALRLSSRDGAQRYEITNISGNIAMNLKFNLVDPESGEIILPAYFSDGYFHLLPGEKRTIEVHSPSVGAIMVEGYNVDNTILKL